MVCKRKRFSVVGLHISLMVGILVSLFVLFFQWVLPTITQQGQLIVVPDLQGMSIEAVQAVLARHQLRFAVTEEKAYTAAYPPVSVIQQLPQAGDRVKKGRKLYLVLNSTQPPTVAMPCLVDGSVKNAQVLLTSYGLRLGQVKYVPDIVKHAVLEQWHDGKKIAAGTGVAIGATIDLVVGAGLGEQRVVVPDSMGMRVDEAVLLLLQAGVKLGNVLYMSMEGQLPGTIGQQVPSAGRHVRLGETVDVWVVSDPGAESAGSAQQNQLH